MHNQIAALNYLSVILGGPDRIEAESSGYPRNLGWLTVTVVGVTRRFH